MIFPLYFFGYGNRLVAVKTLDDMTINDDMAKY
jgi:hypothetical protein